MPDHLHTLTAGDAAAYLRQLHTLKRAPATIEKYARAIRAFTAWLPDGRTVDKETVIAYKQVIALCRAPAGVNAELAALNGLFRHLGWQDCVVRPLRIQRRAFAAQERELTRPEYERLVRTAEARGDQRLSLLLQLMAATGLRVSEIASVTVETLRVGRVTIALKGKIRTILLPGKLCRKLLRFAQERRRAAGRCL